MILYLFSLQLSSEHALEFLKKKIILLFLQKDGEGEKGGF